MEAIDPQLAAVIRRAESVTLQGNTGADLRFILHVRNDMPVLIAEIRRLEAIVARVDVIRSELHRMAAVERAAESLPRSHGYTGASHHRACENTAEALDAALAAP